MHRRDTFTSTPEDAADFERRYGPHYYDDDDRPGPHDLYPEPSVAPPPSIVDLTKDALVAGGFAPRPLGLIAHDGICVFATFPGDDVDAMAACLAARGLEAKMVDGTFHVLYRGLFDGRILGDTSEPPF